MRELVTTLALSRWDADDMMSFAYDLAVRLPGTRAAFLDGRINQERAEIIVRATAVLTPRSPARPKPSSWAGPGG